MSRLISLSRHSSNEDLFMIFGMMLSGNYLKLLVNLLKGNEYNTLILKNVYRLCLSRLCLASKELFVFHREEKGITKTNNPQDESINKFTVWNYGNTPMFLDIIRWIWASYQKELKLWILSETPVSTFFHLKNKDLLFRILPRMVGLCMTFTINTKASLKHLNGTIIDICPEFVKKRFKTKEQECSVANIIQYNDKYILIDFDNATVSLSGVALSDVTENMPQEISGFSWNLRKDDPGKRPSASDALKEIKICIER
nr:881_t:CDS:2 [Entrophospora candida]